MVIYSITLNAFKAFMIILFKSIKIYKLFDRNIFLRLHIFVIETFQTII